MKYEVGDLVQINKDKVKEEYQKYNGVYRIEKIVQDYEGVYLYKLNGVPDWGTEDMLTTEGLIKEGDKE